MKFFYSHLLHHYQELLNAVENLAISKSEKSEAKYLIDRTIHCTVIDLFLEHLHRDHHQRILIRINETPDDLSIIELVNHLTGKDIEIIMSERLTRLQLDILEDLLIEKEGD